MSTRCAIAISQEDGTIKAIYCHHDGYVAGVGTILAGWYNTQEKAEALLELGDLNSLGTKLAPEPEMDHNYNHTQENVTVAYHRDRGEHLEPARIYRDIINFKKHGMSDFGADYLYLYADGKWSVYGLANKPEFIGINFIINKEGK